MPIPPAKKNNQTNYIKTALRLPPDLHAEIHASAEHLGHSMNAEILARLRADQNARVSAELAEIKSTLRKILDAVT